VYAWLCALTAALLLLAAPGTRAQTLYEAENTPPTDRQNCRVGNSWSGFTGAGFVENMTQRGASGTQQGASSLTFTINAPQAGMYTIAARYAAERAYAWSMSVYVNGHDVTQAQFPSTKSWQTWATQTTTVALVQGANTLMYRYDNDDSGWVNIDNILVSPALSAGYSAGSAAAAGWFPKEVSVDQFTGTAVVSLPLAAATAPGLTVPVSLNYAATGVQVEDEGNIVGVNWGLQAGYSIRREVRGLPDDALVTSSTENRYGWLRYDAGSPTVALSQVPAVPSVINAAGCDATVEQPAWSQLEQLGSLHDSGGNLHKMYDTEPDIFYYTLPGHSGKFVFDAQGQAHTIPYDPITITGNGFSTYGITGFTIRTPDGNVYAFHDNDVISQITSAIVGSPKFFLRSYYNALLTPATPLYVTTAWHVSTINGPVPDNQIRFEYDPAPSDYGIPQGRSEQRFLQGNSTATPTAEYRTTTQYINTNHLSAIISRGESIRFETLATGLDEQAACIKTVTLYSRLTPFLQEVQLKKYTLSYRNVSAAAASGRWFDEKGAPLTTGNARRFLSSIQLTTGTVTQPLYSFAYHQIGEKDSPLPPPQAVARDYWGYYNANGASTLIPQLFVYPSLTNTFPSLPGAPYRLYEAPDFAPTGITLNGADRRPAADISVALAGTLTTMTFTGGGKVLFEYDSHRFYDPIARQSLPAGGLRIRTIRAQDPLTKVEVRRDYNYEEETGRTSGVLIHAPRFAFAVPATGTSLAQQLTNGTVRCGEDLGSDPFEGRAIGYRQVRESAPGRGQVVTVFDVSGAADDAVVASSPACVGWQRPLVGVARHTGSSGCPPVAPLQAGTEMYPFPITPNYDFRRGRPLSVQHYAEPTGTSAGTIVRYQELEYQFQYPQGAPSQPITGLAYEPTGNPADGTYAYSKYRLLTDFQYVVKRETTIQPNQTATPSQIVTNYRYNDHGWLAAFGSSNSDGSYQRTRYKYLNEYALSSSSADPSMQAMYQRLNGSSEQISDDIVETFSEVVTPSGDVLFKGATLKTYKIEPGQAPVPSLTRPYQVWQQTQLPQANGLLPLSSSIDSTGWDAQTNSLHIGTGYRPLSTITEVERRLAPISTRVVTGRQVSGVHLGYDGMLPVLQIGNALASEVVFSDFENYNNKAYPFILGNSKGLVPAPTAVAARTGAAGMELVSTTASFSYLLAALPVSTAKRYRLAFWAKATQPTAVDISFTGPTSLPAVPPINIDGSSVWKLYEVTFGDWSTISPSARANYSIRIQPRSTIQIDDVLLLPADALASSTTYDLATGKTSETDGRGRTTYYEYSPAAELTTVRDHNKSIIKQFDRVIAGRYQTQSTSLTPSFTVTGTMIEDDELVFTVDNAPAFGTTYAWSFDDGGTSTANPARHSFTLGDQLYRVRLQITSPQGRVYQTVQEVYVARKLFTITTCVAGIVAIDDCNLQLDQMGNGCPQSQATPSSGTTLSVSANLLGPYTYSWEVLRDTVWETIPNANASTYHIPTPRSPYLYRCRVNAGGGYSGVSDSFGIEHFQSTSCTP